MAVTREDAAIIKGMLKRGDKQQWIEAWFGGDLNAGRISEINTGKKAGAKFKDVAPAAPEELPPPGPYPSGRAAYRALMALEPALAAIKRGVLPGIAALERAVEALQLEGEREAEMRRAIRQRAGSNGARPNGGAA